MESAHWVAHTVPADQVQVQMVDHLPTIVACVSDQAVARLGDAFLLSDLPGDREQATDDHLVLGHQVIDGSDMFIGHDQHVCRRDGMDVAKGGHQLILVERLAGGIPGDDPAESAVGHPFNSPLILMSTNSTSFTIATWFQSLSWATASTRR